MANTQQPPPDEHGVQPAAEGVQPFADEGQPLLLTDPIITIGSTTLQCLMSHAEFNPDVSDIDVVSFCGTKTFPGNVTWHFIATLFQSFSSPGGTDQALWAIWNAYRASGTLPTVSIQARSGTSSATNPTYTATVIPKPWRLIGGDAGGVGEIDIDWTCTAMPTRTPAITT